MNIGDMVEWESQSAGSWTAKKGKIVAKIPPGIYPKRTDYGNRAYYTGTHRFCFEPGSVRNQISYLIEVSGGKTAKAKPKLYWPRVSQLKLVKP